MLEFRWRIEWIGIHDDDADAQGGEHYDGILKKIRQHDREPVTFFQCSLLLHPSCEMP